MLRRISWAIAAMTMTVLAVLPGGTLAGTTGKLTGTVRNEKGQPITGVNIRLEGLRIGALTDDQGLFLMIGIPAGEYSVRANMLGHASYLAEGVNIAPDFTTELNIAMKTEAVQMDEVRVEAERPLLQRDATNTVRFLSSDQLLRLPTRGYQEAAAQQSGIVNFQRLIDRESQNGPTLLIRGGRPNETAYFVDGFSQQDPLTGNATTSINNNAIQEVVIQNGGFSAEYGRIMSGVINVITRQGDDRYHGSLEAVTDNFRGIGKEQFGTTVYDYNVYDGSLGGPLVPGRDLGTFYYSGQRRYQGDRSPRVNFGSPLPSNSLSGWTHQGKLHIPIGQPISLNVGGLWSDDNWQEFLNTYRYNLNHAPRYEDRNRSLTGQLTHTLSARTFYTLGGSFFLTERKRGDGVYFDQIERYGEFPQADIRSDIPWFWPGFTGPTGDPLADSLAASAARAGGNGHVFDDYLRRKSEYIAVKGDLTSQWNPYHQVKFGVEGGFHKLRFYQHFFPVNFATNKIDIDRYGFSEDGRQEIDDALDGPRKPKTFAVYAQDKYERSGVVVNGGVRYDYINTDVSALASQDLPLGTDGFLNAPDLVQNRTYNRVSPRLGIGFPVTERTVMHVNWGKFFQQPNLQDLYVSYRFLEHKVRTGGYFVGFGNPNLRPEQTTAYEVGVAHQFNDFAKMDVTVYYKDVKDLVQISTIPSFPNSFSSYRNSDFATLKGLDLGFTLRRIRNVQANISYSLSHAVGTGSVSNSQRNIAWTASDPPKQTAPLDFDQRHKISLNLDYLLGAGQGPMLGGVPWLQRTNINVLYNIASGTPFTPTNVFDEVTLAAVASQPIGPLNSRYGPWTQSFDFKATRGFGVRSLNFAAYVWVLNAFNSDNAVSVFTGTGSARTTGFFNTPDGQASAQNLANNGIDAQRAYQLALQSPSLFGIPRQARFGLRMDF